MVPLQLERTPSTFSNVKKASWPFESCISVAFIVALLARRGWEDWTFIRSTSRRDLEEYLQLTLSLLTSHSIEARHRFTTRLLWSNTEQFNSSTETLLLSSACATPVKKQQTNKLITTLFIFSLLLFGGSFTTLLKLAEWALKVKYVFKKKQWG